ncbi:MAG: leucine-rich repeat domain-containing protein [Prevotella sp.]|nr:leucine-rich repeat domain-containing protein [Prevotella sp.]
MTALLMSAPMWAKVGDEFTRRGVKYEVKTDYPDDLTAWVVGHESWLYGDVEILDNINGYVVTAIGYNAFQDCTDLKSVIIPYGVKEIMPSAFYGCSGLQSVSIPGSVEMIGDYAFSGCTALTSITFPEGVTSIRTAAFYGCTSLVSVTIPSSMKIFQNELFYECNSVKDVYCYAAPDNLTNIAGNLNSFKTDGTTKFHVEASQLEKAKTRFSEYFNVTFVGDLDSPVLTDSEPYTRTVEKTVSMATYKKTIATEQVGKHQAWLLPFDYEVKAADLAKFSFYKINMIANSPSPDTETSEDAWVFLTKMEAGDKLKANMPYVYKPLAAVTDYQFITTNTPMKAPESSELAKTETMTHVYSFFATYLPTSPRSGFDFYYVNDEGSVSYGEDGDGVTVSPYRWIVRQTSKTGGSTAYAREMHFVDGEGEVTGIDAPLNDNGEMINDSWYTIDGKKLNGEPTKKGVYIVNGKKVVK